MLPAPGRASALLARYASTMAAYRTGGAPAGGTAPAGAAVKVTLTREICATSGAPSHDTFWDLCLARSREARSHLRASGDYGAALEQGAVSAAAFGRRSDCL